MSHQQSYQHKRVSAADAIRQVRSGDAIIVPQKVQSYKGLRNTRDWVDVIFKIAMSAVGIHDMTN